MKKFMSDTSSSCKLNNFFIHVISSKVFCLLHDSKTFPLLRAFSHEAIY